MAATVKSGWELPPPPVAGAVPSYYFDSSNSALHWVVPTVNDYEMVLDGDIEWPFVEDYASCTDLVRLGFYDLEDLPLVEDKD